MKRIALFMLAGVPLLVGQMCGSTAPITDTDTPPGSTNPPAATARTVTGPGFSVVIPAGFDPHNGLQLPVEMNFMEAYADGERLIIVSTRTPEPGGPFNLDSSAIRIQAGQTSDSGDFVLRGRIAAPTVEGEILAAYALLADGELLCVEICPGRRLEEDDLNFGTSLFRSIDLAETDGRPLEGNLWANQCKLLGHTSQGLVVLEDSTAWLLDDELGGDAFLEMRSWATGVPIHRQGAPEQRELLQVGRWVPVPMRELGLVTQTLIVDYDKASRRITFANGQSQYLIHSKLPQSWSVGQEVLLVQTQTSGWIINPKNWQSIQM